VLYGRQCVAPILTKLALQHPKLELDINFSDRLVDLVEDGFDLAVRNGALSDTAGLMARHIASHHMAVCAAPSYFQAYGTPRAVAELEQHKALLYSWSGQTRAWRFPREGQSPIEISPPSRMRFDDLEAIADAAAAGFGLAWLPTWLIRKRVRQGALVIVALGKSAPAFEAHAVWPRTPHLPLRVRLAIDALAAQLPGVTEP
jgi:DNA-binding transcriptional LysR family regulator